MTRHSHEPGRRAAVLGLAGTLAAPAILRAQTRWRPERPIVIYNPFATGGITDLHMRLLGERVSKTLGQQVLVEAKPGAAGTLAPAALMTAKPDGHTLACMSINSLRYPHYQQVAWHPLRDFTYLSGLSAYTMGIVVRARHVDVADRVVAIKVMATDLDEDPEAPRRFQREGEVLASLDHPHIVRVYDQRVISGDNLQLLYMQYVAGGTLERATLHVLDVQGAGDFLQ